MGCFVDQESKTRQVEFFDEDESETMYEDNLWQSGNFGCFDFEDRLWHRDALFNV